MHGHPLSRPLRWAQLTLVENDPGRYDPAFWLDYFRRTHAEGACLSAGGVVAYYPTKVPFHHRSAWMVEGTDPFGELARGCAESGMVVLARTDPHAIHADVFGAHPEWAARGADGKPRPHWSSPEMFVARPAVDEDAIHRIQRGQLPVHLRHEPEPIGPERAGHEHLR
jgi:hypothetical protein